MGILGLAVCAANVYTIYDLFFGDEGIVGGIQSVAGKVLLTIVSTFVDTVLTFLIASGARWYCVLHLVRVPGVQARHCT